MPNPPKISVMMSIYNEPVEWLKLSIESILNQTFKEFEFIIVNDNPQNINAKKYLNSLKDLRIKLIINRTNIGLAKSLNIAATEASAPYFARMDADDISFPQRLEAQYSFLSHHPKIALVGTNMIMINKEGKETEILSRPTNPKTLKRTIAYKSSAFHPSWLLRKEVFEGLNGYRDFPTSQDYDFIYRCTDKGYLVSNLNKNLMYYRFNPNGISSSKALLQKKIKHYIYLLHKERTQLGYDNFSEGAINQLKIEIQSEKEVFNCAQTKLEEAEKSMNENRIISGGLKFISIFLTSKWHRKAITNTLMYKIRKLI